MSRPPRFDLERFFAQYEFSGVDLLCSSDCDTITVGQLLALEPSAREKLDALRLGYTDSAGDPELRALISGLYEGVSPEHVIVHASGVEPILNVFHALLEPGDAVVIQTPIYGAAPGVADWTRCEIKPWPMREKPHWHIDLDLLREHLSAGARMVYLNTPHNPTGWHATFDELAKIVKLCEHHGAVLFVDEVYRDAEYEDRSRLPGAVELSAHCVSLGVLSKSYGLAGLRIGWIATKNAELLQSVSEVKDYTSICTSAVSEFLAQVALRNRRAILDRLRELIRRNLATVDRFMAEHAGLLSWSRPMAGPVGFVRLREGESAKRFCDLVRQEANVLLLPSTVFAWGDRHFRIGFGRADCEQVLTRLGDLLRRPDGPSSPGRRGSNDPPAPAPT